MVLRGDTNLVLNLWPKLLQFLQNFLWVQVWSCWGAPHLWSISIQFCGIFFSPHCSLFPLAIRPDQETKCRATGEVGRQWRWGAKERIRGLVKAAWLDSFQPSSAEKLLWNSLCLVKGRSLFMWPLKEITLIGSRITKTLTTCCHERRSGFVCCTECFFLKKTGV